jgi:hypothetical protein
MAVGAEQDALGRLGTCPRKGASNACGAERERLRRRIDVMEVKRCWRPVEATANAAAAMFPYEDRLDATPATDNGFRAALKASVPAICASTVRYEPMPSDKRWTQPLLWAWLRAWRAGVAPEVSQDRVCSANSGPSDS